MQISHESSALPLFNQLEIKLITLRSAKAEKPSDWSWNTSYLPYNVFYFITDGSIEAELLEKNGAVICRKTMTAGNVYLLPYGCAFNMYTKEGFSKYYMHAGICVHSGLDIFRGYSSIISCPLDQNGLTDVFAKRDDDTLLTALKAKRLVYETLCRLLEENGSAPLKKRIDSFSKYPAELAYALHYISEHISAELTVGEIISKTGVSASAFGNLFRKHLDTTPKAYISARLFEKSCEMLLTTDRSLKQIALDLSFTSQFAFSKFIKSHSGYSPSEYRRIFS